LLYLVPAVDSFCDAVNEFAITNHHPFGNFTVVALIGLKSINFAHYAYP